MSKELLADMKATLKQTGYKEVFIIPETQEIHFDEFRAKKSGRKVKKIAASKVLGATSWESIFGEEKQPKAEAEKTAKAAGGKKGAAEKTGTDAGDAGAGDGK